MALVACVSSRWQSAQRRAPSAAGRWTWCGAWQSVQGAPGAWDATSAWRYRQNMSEADRAGSLRDWVGNQKPGLAERGVTARAGVGRCLRGAMGPVAGQTLDAGARSLRGGVPVVQPDVVAVDAGARGERRLAVRPVAVGAPLAMRAERGIAAAAWQDAQSPAVRAGPARKEWQVWQARAAAASAETCSSVVAGTG